MKGKKRSTVWKCPPFNVLVFCGMCYKELFVNVCNKGSLQKRSPARKIEDSVYFKAIFKNKNFEKKNQWIKEGYNAIIAMAITTCNIKFQLT